MTQTKIVVVTGYVQIPDHPRGHDEYVHLGARLGALRSAPVRRFRCELKDCWLYDHVQGAHSTHVRHAVGDNPEKNTLAYHVVIHQKTAWLLQALETDPDAEVFVWIDWGILHLSDVTVDVIDDFLGRVHARTEIAVPGAWNASSGDPTCPDWRFCGGVLVVPRGLVRLFHAAACAVTLERLATQACVTWEVNDWAEVERRGLVPIRWYKADHDRTMFTDYSPEVLHE